MFKIEILGKLFENGCYYDCKRIAKEYVWSELRQKHFGPFADVLDKIKDTMSSKIYNDALEYAAEKFIPEPISQSLPDGKYVIKTPGSLQILISSNGWYTIGESRKWIVKAEDYNHQIFDYIRIDDCKEKSNV